VIDINIFDSKTCPNGVYVQPNLAAVGFNAVFVKLTNLPKLFGNRPPGVLPLVELWTNGTDDRRMRCEMGMRSEKCSV